jgi:DNA primase
VVVEGYTDVMACHLAGVDTAVATCGTAFGSDHIKVVRRIMRDDDDVHPAEVVFTFDGDAAGRKAALRAFAEDQRFVSQTYVAVEPGGLDPCDLRVQRGDEAVRDLVARRVPLFEFAITTTIGRFDLGTAEGRVQALRAAAPVVAQIKDRSLRPEYARRLAGLVGIDVEEARRAVGAAASRAPAPANAPAGRRPGGPVFNGYGAEGSGRPTGMASWPGAEAGAPDRLDGAPAGATGSDDGGRPPGPPPVPRPDLRDPTVAMERQLLQCVLQAPHVLEPHEFDALGDDAFTAPAHRAVAEAVRRCGGLAAAEHADAAWVEEISLAVADEVRPYVTDLAVAPLPFHDEALARSGVSLQVQIAERDLLRREAEVHSRMQRMDAAGDAVGYTAALREAQVLVERRQALRELQD